MTEETTITVRDETRFNSRQREIIAAASALFRDQGVDQTTMAQIAKAAGFSKRTLYIYFENKDELLSAVVLAGFQSQARYLEPYWAMRTTGLETIRNLANAYADFALSDPAAFELTMLYEHREYYKGRAAGPGEFATACQAANDRMNAAFTSLIERGVQDGSFELSVSPQQFNLLFWASLAGVLQVAISRREILDQVYGWSPREMVEACIQQFIKEPR